MVTAEQTAALTQTDLLAAPAPLATNRFAKTADPDTRWPELLDYLRAAGFLLVPNHPRPLDGRVVAHWCDPTTKQLRAVTDYELVGRLLFSNEHRGRDVRQTFYFATDGVRLRFNEFWEYKTSHYGLQYASTCHRCSDVRWNNVDRSPHPLCADCQREDQTAVSGRCPETRRAPATAYKRHGCRCGTCRAWNAAKHRRLRHQRNPGVSPQDKHHTATPELTLPPVVGLRTNSGVTPVGTDPRPGDPAGWTWVPASVTVVVAAYVADLHAVQEALQETHDRSGTGRCAHHGWTR